MNLFSLFFLLLSVGYSTKIFSQNLHKNISIKDIPKNISYKGKVINAVSWKGKLGQNIVITTETGNFSNTKNKKGNDGLDAEIYGYHYIIDLNKTKKNWVMTDYIKDCPVDIEAKYIPNTFNITDLNQDGVNEIWLMYKTVCHGDVSPMTMKIIMYQGDKKYAMRGRNKAYYGTDKNGKKLYEGGEYELSEEFKNDSTVFIEYAKKLWAKNIMNK